MEAHLAIEEVMPGAGELSEEPPVWFGRRQAAVPRLVRRQHRRHQPVEPGAGLARDRHRLDALGTDLWYLLNQAIETSDVCQAA